MTTHRSVRGFTLIEMLIILTIMMFLAVVSFPMMVEAIETSKLRGITQGAVSLMRLARYEAIKSNACGLVQLDAANRQVSSFLDQDCNTATGNKLLGTLALPSGVTATSTFTGDVIFRGTGSADGTGTLRFENRKGTARVVSVDSRSTGKISVL
jgi:Tfp pilus assembly protein FimT